MKNHSGLWIIIPGWNEEKHIANVIETTKKYCKNIIVVDDGSVDRTYSIAQEFGVHVLRHIVNLGKGAGLKTGVEYAISKGAKFVIAVDADGQHDPAMIPKFADELKGCDIVFGYRKFSGKMPVLLRFGNWGINLMTKVLFGIKLKDTQSGYRGFRTSIYPKIRWKATDYFVETEMIANVGMKKLKYKEIPIATVYADKYKGTTVFDGIKIGINMIIRRLTR